MGETDSLAEAVEKPYEAMASLRATKVIVTAGLTIENRDAVRAIKNRSSGKMGVAIAEEALARGAKVTLIYGSATADSPVGAKVIRVETTKEMFDAVGSELKLEKCHLLVATAVTDIWTPRKPSDQVVAPHVISVPARKPREPLIVDMVKKFSPETFLVPFRAERGLSNEELINSAYQRLKAAKADLVAANDVGREGTGFGVDTNEVFIVDPARNVTHIPLATKREVAQRLLELVESKFSK